MRILLELFIVFVIKYKYLISLNAFFAFRPACKYCLNTVLPMPECIFYLQALRHKFHLGQTAVFALRLP